MNFFRLLYRAGVIWLQREADIHAAALAYFIPFALTPLLLLSITVVGLLIGGSEVATLLLGWGNSIAPDLTGLLDMSVKNFNALTSTYVIPVFAILFFSTMIVVSLNSVGAALHKIWLIEASGWKSMLERSVRSLLFVVLLQVYLVCIILLNRTINYIADFPLVHILALLSPVLVFSGTVLLITFGYGLLPVRSLPFRARLYGAMVASVLFFFTREIVTLHTATSPIPDVFGAAGLVILLLVWIYVSASIVLYGAAFAGAYEEQKRSRWQ